MMYLGLIHSLKITLLKSTTNTTTTSIDTHIFPIDIFKYALSIQNTPEYQKYESNTSIPFLNLTLFAVMVTINMPQEVLAFNLMQPLQRIVLELLRNVRTFELLVN